MTPADFVKKVAAVRMPSVFNPYADTCPIYDRADAPSRRRANLEAFLRAAIDARELSIWVGRDLGYRGGRRTGIALTDEVHLDSLSSIYAGTITLRKATHGPAIAERTASVFWEMISRIKSSVFTWNVFPFHPHIESNPLTNRCHTRSERAAGEPILLDVVRLLRPTQIVAIGNDAESALKNLGISCIKVRHPSYGGISDFRSGVASSHSLAEPVEYDPTPKLL